MNQQVVCNFIQCPFRSSNGFCLNRLTVITEHGMCKHLTRPDWQDPIEDRFKNNYKVANDNAKEEELLIADAGENQEESELEGEND